MDTSNTGGILGFRRDPDFIHRRARTRHEAGDLFEALELYRRASAAAPMNAAFGLDVANMLSCMGCARASYDHIVHMINCGLFAPEASDSEFAGALMLQARNMDALGLGRAAREMLFKARSHADIPCDEERLLDGNPTGAEGSTPVSIKSKALSVIRRMQRYGAVGDSAHAYALARRFLRHSKGPLAHAIMAWAYAMRNDPSGTTEHLVKSLAMKQRNPWVMCIAARILAGGDNSQAEMALQNAFALSDGYDCDDMILSQAAELNIDELVSSTAERMLTCRPLEPRLSAHMAVAMIRAGTPTRAALAILRQCLKVYPNDPTAQHYLELIEHWSPDMPAILYPDREMQELWLREMDSARKRAFSGQIIADSVPFERALEWGLNCSNIKVSSASARMLSLMALDEERRAREAREALWQFMASFELPDRFRYNALIIMMEMHCTPPAVIFSHGRLHRLGESTLCKLVAANEDRTELRKATRRLRHYPKAIYELKPMLALSDARGSAHVMACALEMAFRMAHGERISLRQCARRRNLSCRQLTDAVHRLCAVHPSGRQLQ